MNQAISLALAMLLGWSMPIHAAESSPPTFVIVPHSSIKEAALVSEAQKIIRRYLDRRGWMVIDKRPDKKLELPPFLNQANGPIGEAYQLAWLSDTDLFLAFEMSKKQKDDRMALELSLQAIDVVSSIKAGSETAISSAYPDEPASLSKAVEDVCGQAMPSLIETINAYLLNEKERGATFSIMIHDPPKNTDLYLSIALGEKCSSRRVRREDHSVRATVRWKGDRKALLDLVKSMFKKRFPDISYQVVPTHKRYLLFVISK